MLKKTKKILAFLIKLFISVSLITWVILKIDFSMALELLADIQPIWLFFSFALIFLSLMLITLRWSWLLQSLNYHFNYLKLCRIYWVANTLGSFVPGSIGSEVLRVYSVAPDTGHIPAITSSLFADRVIGFISLALVSMACMFVALKTIEGLTGFILVLIASLLLIFVFFFILTNKKIITKLGSLNGHKIFQKIIETLHKVAEIKNDKHALTKCFVLSIIIQLNRVLTAYLFAVAIGTEISLIYFLIFIPIIFFIKQPPYNNYQ